MNYKQKTQKAVLKIWGLQKAGGYRTKNCPLCKIYKENKTKNDDCDVCEGCLTFVALKRRDNGCGSFKTFRLSGKTGNWTIRAEHWQDVIPILKAIDRKFFTPRFCKSHPEQARKKFAFMLDIDNKIYNKYK